MNEYSPRKKFLIVVSLIIASWGPVFCAVYGTVYGTVRIAERFGIL